MPKKKVAAPAKAAEPHQFTQEHAVRMYQTLGMVKRGLDGGQVKSKPLLEQGGKYRIRSLDDYVIEAMQP